MNSSANTEPTYDDALHDEWSPLEELAKGLLPWLEEADLCNLGDLKVSILTLERATATHPVVPLPVNPDAHVRARLLRLLRSALVQLQNAANKGR